MMTAASVEKGQWLVGLFILKLKPTNHLLEVAANSSIVVSERFLPHPG